MRQSLSLCLITTLLLSACSQQQQSPARTSHAATPAEIAQQLQAYADTSAALVAGVQAALQPGTTSQSLKALDLSSNNRAKLESLRQQALERFPNLIDQPAWLAESSQLIGLNEAGSVTSNLDGLFVIATVAQDDPQKTAWVATVTVDVTGQQIENIRLNTTLSGGYFPPAYRYVGEDGKLPYIRRTYAPAGGPSTMPVETVSAMSVPSEEASQVIVYSQAGERLR
ncbi:hypothetical protein [Deinococcus gobiensis]|uniref:Lipoprotein n=1 Tax=Deinococcus gobiensis (strain DSM 21396 / JCM 16679 / CGMCC 1.7299 / I-0) TaxID=745776 RepID=H8H327_DEIGI|nr:hypothetical protein [Deinococcus gobiensis]AFD27924.1 hypothetical protein DGo_PC0132 [Deinococcus gobiensis I-0]